MPAPLPHDIRAYRRLRWRARAWTGLVALVIVPTLVQMLVLASSADPDIQRRAAWSFFQGGLALVVCAPVLWFQWRRSYRARPVILPERPTPGELVGVPELDPSPRPHASINGAVELPRRW